MNYEYNKALACNLRLKKSWLFKLEIVKSSLNLKGEECPSSKRLSLEVECLSEHESESELGDKGRLGD